MKKFIFPVAMILLGTGSAFATKVVNEKTKANVPGYRVVNLGSGQFSCVDAGKKCSDINTGPICTWSIDGTTPLQSLVSPTMCGTTLHEIQP